MGSLGTHIILPSYFSPSKFGLVDMRTSDNRFLFFLPWNNAVLVGTTDRKFGINEKIPVTPYPPEEDILWLLSEARKYIHPSLEMKRHDVLSAWCGIRPLALGGDVSTAELNSAQVSRDHVVCSFKDGFLEGDSSIVVYVTGGKWTTYRKMFVFY